MPGAHQQYCSGRITKNASTRLRWSPRRVGDSVRNSRSAKNDTSANNTVAVVSPDSQPTQNTIAITQLLRSTPSARASSTRRVSPSAVASCSRIDSRKTTMPATQGNRTR
jgi:hypothetical protein